MRGGITSAVPGFVKNTVPESQASTKNTISDAQSIRICLAIHFLICSVAGAAALPTPGPTLEPPAKASAPSGAVTASGTTFGRGIDISRSAGEPTLQEMSLRTVIYAKKSDWQRITGDTQQFKDLPLWNPKTIGGDDLTQPELGRPAHTFGGWTSRVGKQYELDTVLNNPPIKVDLNVFDLSVFSASNPNFSLRSSDPDVPTLVVKK